MKYQASFNGRRQGALGIFYHIFDTVEAENKEAAELKLYEKWEHITRLSLTPTEKGFSLD